MYNPISYQETIFPFGLPGPIQSNDWVLWTNSASDPLTLSFTSSLAVNSVWIPQLTGPVTFYAGTEAVGTPFYVSGGAGSELVPIPVDTLDVTMVGSGGNMYVYYTSLVLEPFRFGVIGNQVTAVTATLPILSSGGVQPNISLQVPLAIAYGGTGSVSPVGVQAASGSGVIITGSFPDQTISLDFAGLGVVTAVTASSPLSSTGGTTPNISLASAVPLNLGGTGQTAPALNTGSGLNITGTIFQPSGGSAWTITNTGIVSLEDDNGTIYTGDITLHGTNGIVTDGSGASLHIDGSALALIGGSSTTGITSQDGTVNVTKNPGPYGAQNVDLSISGKVGLPIYYNDGSQQTGNHCVINNAPISMAYSSNTVTAATVTLSGRAVFSNNNYQVAPSVQGTTGGSPPVVTFEINSMTSSGFQIAAYGTGGSGSGTFTVNFIAIGN